VPSNVCDHSLMNLVRYDTLLTVEEVAARLHVHPQTARRYLHAGELRFVRLGAGEFGPVRVRERDLEAYLADTKETQ
jgi:excisionase family DNA binding protein